MQVKLVAFIADALGPALPPGLRARSEEDVSIASDVEDYPYGLRPDVVVSHSQRTAAPTRPQAVLTPAGPHSVILHVKRNLPTQKRVVILDSTEKNRVVTAIEILSPVNKQSGRGNGDYLRKLDVYRRGRINLVEIDLLRWPTRESMEFGQLQMPADSRTPHLISVHCATEPNDWEIFPVSLRAAIPVVPVPLRPVDAEIPLDLQPLIDRIYFAGGYDGDIDYTQPPTPPLDAEDAEWARSLVARFLAEGKP